MIDKEVIFAEDVEEIFGKRPWASRSEEIISASKTSRELKEAEEKVILVGVQLNENEPAEESLDELGELAKTAGAEVVGRMIQSREYIHPATYIGKEK